MDIKRFELKSLTLQSPLEAWMLGVEKSGRIDKKAALLVPEISRAVDIIASGCASYPYGMYRGNDEVTDKETPEGWRQLMYDMAADYVLFGAAYALIERNRFGVARPRRLQPQTIDVKFDQVSGKPVEFWRSANGGSARFSADEIVYVFAPNYFGEAGPGNAPIDAALAAAGLSSAQFDMLKGYYERGAPLTLFTYSGLMDESEGNALVRWWNEVIRRGQQAYRAILMRGDVKPQVFGSNAKDAFTPEVINWVRESICVALGIPMSVILSNAANYATAMSDRAVLQENTLRPMVERLFSAWNEQYFSKFGLEIWAEHDATNANSQAFLERATALAQVVGAPVMTVDEGRALLNLDPLPETVAPVAPAVAPAVQPQEAAPEPPTQEQLKGWRRDALRAFDAGEKFCGTPFDDELAACKNKSEIRGVFERHWPRAERRDVAAEALLDELRMLRQALEGAA